jgi:serine/threonine-protein kinase
MVIIQQVLEALRYLHRRNIVHRDLKSQNVMLVNSSGGSDFVKVLDFGTAKMLAGERRDITVRGTLVGTPSVMSPEQIRQGTVDGRTDVYAAGVMLYEMVVGHKPFQHQELEALMRMHLEQAPPSPRRLLGRDALDPGLEAIILRALAKDPAARFQTAKEMSEAIAAAWSAVALAPRSPPRRRRRRWRLAPLLLAAGLLVLIVVLTANRLAG